MTPALIRQLIDIATLPDPETLDGCVDELLYENLIRHGGHGLQVTERGAAMVDMLCAVPLPIQKWLDPRSVK